MINSQKSACHHDFFAFWGKDWSAFVLSINIRPLVGRVENRSPERRAQSENANRLRWRAVFVATCTFVLHSIAAQATPEKGWMLVQTSPMMGDHSFFITKNAMRAESKNRGVVLITKAPKWDVIVYNSRLNKYCQVPFAQFKGETTSRLFNGHRDNIITGKWTESGEETACGAHCVKWTMVRKPILSWQQNARFDFGHVGACSGSTFWVLKGFQMPPVMGHLISQLDGVRDSTAIPIKFLYYDETHTETVQLLTTVCKEQPLSDALFQVPAKAQKIDNEEALYQDPQSQEIMHGCIDFLNDVDPDIKQARDKSDAGLRAREKKPVGK